MTPDLVPEEVDLGDPARLEALRRSGLLKRTVAERLDHLVFAASRLLLADAAQLNVLDHHQQYTILGYPPDDWPSFPVEDSGCRKVVASGKPFAVDDAQQHEVTCNMPWTSKFRGYLGAPIIFDSQVIGSICVLTTEPRYWKVYEISALVGVARLASMSILPS